MTSELMAEIMKKQYENCCCVCSKSILGQEATQLEQLPNKNLIFKLFETESYAEKYGAMLSQKVCKFCTETFVNFLKCKAASQVFYKKLENEVKNRKIFVCDTCWGKFLSEAELTEHKKTHEVPNVQEVPMEIDSSCNQSEGISLQTSVDSEPSPDTCSYCKKIFPKDQHSSYLRHMVHERELRKEKEKCLLCTKIFKNLFFLAKHIIDNHFPEIEAGKVAAKDTGAVVNGNVETPEAPTTMKTETITEDVSAKIDDVIKKESDIP